MTSSRRMAPASSQKEMIRVNFRVLAGSYSRVKVSVESPANEVCRGEMRRGSLSGSLDVASYTATPIMSDGTKGPGLELRALFETTT